MSEKNNILNFGKPKGTIEIQSHPDEIIDVAPEVLAIMNARLKGETFENLYGQRDNVSDRFLIRKEVEKLKQVFSCGADVYESFASLVGIKEARQMLKAEEVDRDLISSYALKKMNGEHSDEVDVYAGLMDGIEWVTKHKRVSGHAPKGNFIFDSLREFYLGTQFDALGISKEVIELQPTLQSSFRSGRIADEMNALLNQFYGKAG